MRLYGLIFVLAIGCLVSYANDPADTDIKIDATLKTRVHKWTLDFQNRDLIFNRFRVYEVESSKPSTPKSVPKTEKSRAKTQNAPSKIN